MIRLVIPTPKDFIFRATVESHGWCQLAPNHYDAATGHLMRPYQLQNGKLVSLLIEDSQSRSMIVTVTGQPIISSRDRNDIMIAIRQMFNLDQSLSAFYKTMANTDGYAWVNEKKSARLLASPTVWEDLVKTLLTTNTSWSNTVTMAENLSNLDPNGIFPSAQVLADYSEDALSEKAGTGYRTGYLHQLAQQVTAGDIDPEQWRNLDSQALYNAITDLAGFGDYAAGTVMRLLGHFDKLAIDTVARKAFEYVTGDAPESDTDIRTYYEPFGKWRGLVLWMDCIRDETDTAPQPIAE